MVNLGMTNLGNIIHGCKRENKEDCSYVGKLIIPEDGVITTVTINGWPAAQVKKLDPPIKVSAGDDILFVLTASLK